MDAITFIKELRASGFSLEAIGERLAISPASGLRDEHRTFVRQHKPELLWALTRGQPGSRPVSPAPKPAATPTAVDLLALAASIAMEFHVSAAAVQGLLDDDDRREIEVGDSRMIEALRTAVRALIHRGEWRAAELVRCCDCAHAQPVAPGLIDCARKVPAPGACGPFRWWADDSHLCETWEAIA